MNQKVAGDLYIVALSVIPPVLFLCYFYKYFNIKPILIVFFDKLDRTSVRRNEF